MPSQSDQGSGRLPAFLKTPLALNVMLAAVSAAVTLVAIFALGEMYLRTVFQTKDRFAELKDMAAFHQERGWVMQPGDYTYVDLRAFRSTTISINDSGFRGAPVAMGPAPAPRITLVGDSFLFAANLEDEVSVAGRLRAATQGAYEIANISVPAYGTGQQIQMLSHLTEAGYDPGERLILFFFTNDILDNLGQEYRTGQTLEDRPVFAVGSDGEMSLAQQPAPAQTGDTPQTSSPRSLFFAFLKTRLQMAAIKHPEIAGAFISLTGRKPLSREPSLLVGWYKEDWEDRWSLTADLLGVFHDRFSDGGQRPVDIVIVPSPLQAMPSVQKILSSKKELSDEEQAFLDAPYKPQRTLMAFCKAEGLSCFDPMEAMHAAGEEKPTYFPSEGHLNEHGAGALAAYVAETVLAQNRHKNTGR